MQRHPALIPLSRDHHVALYMALRLRRTDVASAADARHELLAFWLTGGASHFDAEETILLPAIEPHPLCATVIAQHDEIRELIAAITATAAPDPSLLHALGVRLAEHVRLEERELFPLIERSLDESTLVRIAAETTAFEATLHAA